MASRLTHGGKSETSQCAGCKKMFKRLSTHIAQSPICEQLYTTCHNFISDTRVSSNVPTQGPCFLNDLPHPHVGSSSSTRNAANAAPLAGKTNVQSSRGVAFSGIATSTIGQEHILEDKIDDDCEDEFPLIDDALPWNNEGEDPHVDEEGAPDQCVLKLYEELRELRSNPLGLDRFSREEKVHIELLHLLKELNAPLNAFTRILNWSAQANASGHIFQEDCQPSREKVVQKLYCRYNMKGLIPKEKQLYLPYSKRIVSMVYFDASAVFASLLSCPLLNRDENFLFHAHKDPFVEPSKSSDIGDINTGRCYRRTYKELVKKKGVDIILPTVVAMDKTHVDTYGRMQMEPITISHGLLKHGVRSQHSAMRILGYICQFPAHKPTSKKGSVNSGFAATTAADIPDGTVVGRVALKCIPNVSWPTYLLNEMHMQIKFILEESGFLDLQRNGFSWMLHYNGKVYPIVLHPYIPFIIGDTEGHDRLCGHFTARFSSIKQLCRVCECPTLESGYSKGRYPHRKPAAINRLVRLGDLQGLKAMSQNYLVNGFDQARFGLHNKRGIFGACPGEMLHLISLGWFKYCLEAFAAQAGGPDSVSLKYYDRLCASIGGQLSRHSDRDLPRMNFPKGFSSGTNLMGHEITGCLLVKLFAMHTSSFRQIFTPTPLKRAAKILKKLKVKEPKKSKKPKSNNPKKSKVKDPELQKLSNEKHLADWILVVSSLLQWHQWMKQSTIPKAQVTKSHCAVQWLMRQVAGVSPRASGMGNNTIKTHLVLHLCEDILDHGVPENVNSAYAESAHIPLSKITARNTQKRAKTFTRQAANRYIENLAIASAWQDIQQDIIHKGSCTAEKSGGDDALPLVSGREFTISWTRGNPSPSFCWTKKNPKDSPGSDSLSSNAMRFLGQHCLLPFLIDGKLPCFTEFICVNGHKYRAHPRIYDGKPWNDHAMVEWRGYPYPLPALIHTFVDLRHLPHGAQVTLQESGQPPIKKAGVYALIHSFDAIDEEVREFTNTMIGRYKLNCKDECSEPTLFMVNVNNLVAPTIGIQDLGADENYLFLFRRKEEWAASWDSIINKCHEDRDSPSLESDYEEEEVDNDINDEGDVEDEECDYVAGEDDAVEDDDDDDDDDDEDDDDVEVEVVARPQTNKKKKRRRN